MSSLAIVDVFVLAENRLLREALLRVFAKKNEIRVVGSNSYTPDIHEQIMATTPAIIVLDSIGFSRSSAQLISTLRSAIPEVKLVMVDMDADELTFSSSHLAEQIAVKSFVPVIAISSDHALTTSNIPWIFRLPEGTSLGQALKCLSAAIAQAGPNRSSVREILASGKPLAGVRFASTGEVRQ